MNHDEFVKVAMKNYDSLPQERSEIYKRYFISMPSDLKSFGKNAPGTGLGNYRDKVLEGFSSFGTKFDVVLGNGIFAGSQNPFVKVEGPNTLALR